jgi:hypothetical protein
MQGPVLVDCAVKADTLWLFDPATAQIQSLGMPSALMGVVIIFLI